VLTPALTAGGGGLRRYDAAQRELHVLVLAPLTALAAAVRADREGALSGLGGLYIQGVAEVDPTLGTLLASSDSTNMREDMDAAKVSPRAGAYPPQPSPEGDTRWHMLSVSNRVACAARVLPLALGSSACSSAPVLKSAGGRSFTYSFSCLWQLKLARRRGS
jgi:hypothetical protein